MGQKAIAFPYDATNTQTGITFINQAILYLQKEKQTDTFDFLINNAGSGLYKLIVDTTEEDFDNMFMIHLKSVYFLTQQALPFLNNGGSIINISSGLTRFSMPKASAYAMMKGGIEVFTRYLAKELGPRKIKANVVAPGAMATDFGEGVNRDNKEKRDLISGITALGDVGKADDIGGVIAFLCSDKAGWINGQRIEVSGGMLL